MLVDIKIRIGMILKKQKLNLSRFAAYFFLYRFFYLTSRFQLWKSEKLGCEGQKFDLDFFTIMRLRRS